MLRTSPLVSGACGLVGLGSTLEGLFDLWLEDVIRIKIESVDQPGCPGASVDIALQRGEGNGLRHRAGMTLPARTPVRAAGTAATWPRPREAVHAPALFSGRRW